MCGFIGFTGASEHRERVLKNMMDAIAHRGPDAHDTYIDDEVALGFRRLSIIDLKTGSQPIYNEDGSKVLLFNGEIYNYKILREKLAEAGHIFRTQSDSEVLVHGYEEYGPALLLKLRGMFSFIIWDAKEKKLFGARDFFGIKPFYYAQMDSIFMVGSEIKGFLRHPGFKKELYEEKLPDYLTFSCVPGYETFFRNVYKLPPGHYMEYQDGVLKLTRYFIPEFNIETDKTMEYFAEQISRVFAESVTAHEISDVEVGCFLSGGVDSSYVVREVSKSRKPRTYSIGFKDIKYDESAHAKEFVGEINVENRTTLVSSEDYFANVGKVQYHMDEPLANPSANLLYFLSKMAAEDVKVVLSGEGADEMFGGYNVYKEPLMLAGYRRIPHVVRKVIAGIAALMPDFKGKNMLLRGAMPIEERYIGNSNIFSVTDRQKILKKKYPAKAPQEYVKPFYDAAKDKDDVTKMQYVDINVWMVQEILLKADKMSMAHSLELRVPFLDIEVFKLASRIPVEYKVSKENTKLALRKAAQKEMPDPTANRTKRAFPLPLMEWLREERYSSILKKYFTSDNAKKFFDEKKLIRLLDEHTSEKKNNARKLWTVFTFLIWYEEFFI